MIRLGLMSFAHVHAEAYVENIRGIADTQLVGAADDDRARGEQCAAKLGVQPFPTYQDLLAQHLDGVIVCSENTRHRALVEMAARAGVSVLCEKPLATTLPDARAMIEVCARAGVILMVAFPMRFSAPLLQARQAVEEGRVGKIACCIGTNQGQNPRRHRAWFVDKQLAGGGAVMDHTVHLVDILRWYLRTEVAEVYAQTTELLPGGNGGVETGGLLLLTLANGLFASIDCSWSRPASYPTWGGLALELIGERGVLRAVTRDSVAAVGIRCQSSNDSGIRRRDSRAQGPCRDRDRWVPGPRGHQRGVRVGANWTASAPSRGRPTYGGGMSRHTDVRA